MDNFCGGCGDEKCIFAGFLETPRMRGQRPAYRVGRSDSRVTGIAASANLAAMLAILQAVIGTLRSALRPRASLVAENLVLRQQLAFLRRAAPRPQLRPIDRRRPADPVVPVLSQNSIAVHAADRS